MIDLLQLTQQQLWGVAYACQKYNADKTSDNQLSVQAYADQIFNLLAWDYYKQLVQSRIEGQVIPMLLSLPPEEQEAKIAEFDLPNMIEDKYISELMNLGQ